MADEDAEASFELAVMESVVADIGIKGITVDTVDVEFSSGSVVAEVGVFPPADVAIDDVTSRIVKTQDTLLTTIVSKVSAIPGIDKRVAPGGVKTPRISQHSVK